MKTEISLRNSKSVALGTVALPSSKTTSGWAALYKKLLPALFALVLSATSVSAGVSTVTVSGSTGADGSYATLGAAFTSLNANTTQTGNTIIVSIIGDTNEGASSATLNAPTGGNWTSLTISPTGARIVTGATTAGSALVSLNGASSVTIDGLNSGGNSLTISNTTVSATASTSTIAFINGASNDTVRNSTILGSSTAAAATAGGNVLFSTSTVAGGNSNNTISNNDIGPAGANLPSKGVMGLGTAANPNTGNVIDSNNIFDFFLAGTGNTAGVSIQANNNNWTISNNRFYQTATRTFTGTAGVRYSGILVNSPTGTFIVTGNTIGFGAANGTGTTTITGTGTGLGNEVRGIAFTNCSSTTFSSVQGNTISGINVTSSRNSTSSDLSAFIGIQSGTSAADAPANIGNSTGNTIGSLDGSSTIVVNQSSTTNNTSAVQGILDFNFVGPLSISNNSVGSITINNGGTGTRVGFRGILVGSTTGANRTVNNNTIGGTAAGSITDNIVGTIAMYAIQIGSANVSATGNLIRNMVGNSTTANGVVLSGILTTGSTGANTISRNTIHSLSNNSGAASNSIYALYCSFAAVAGNLVERNFVHSLSITSTALTSQLVGILPVAGNGTYQNNMVRLGIDASGASITPGYVIYGMFEIAGTNNLYFNSVYLGGTGVTSSSNTFAFVSNVVTNTRNYKDNIFWNDRDNASGAGGNFAIAVGGTTPNPTGLTSNYNDLLATGVGGFVGLFNGSAQLTLSDWQTATGQDAMSISDDPLFVNPVGTAATVNLHIICGSPADNAGTPIAGITNDFDNDARGTPPDIGADELILNPPTPVSAVSRKTHGGAGDFNINLPLVGPAGIECRYGGATGDYQIVIMFASTVNIGGAVVSSGTGSVASTTGNGTNTITVNLTGVTTAQYITVKLLCVDDGTNLGSVFVTMGVLVGDTTADGTVDSSDVSQVRSEVGNAVGANFREDVTASGEINSGDVALTKSQSGSSLPPAQNLRTIKNNQSPGSRR